MAYHRRRGGRRRFETITDESVIDYKNIDLLQRFVGEGGRINSRRRTRTPARQQRKLTRAIKQARHVALMPFTSEQKRLYG